LTRMDISITEYFFKVHQPDGKGRIPVYILNLYQPHGWFGVADYSSSHKDWSCWTGLHTPSKADALCDIPPRAPYLCVHQTGSRGGAEARR
jgi:hypothetical protein